MLTNRANTLNEIINLFMLNRITTTIEKRLRRNKKYRELEEKGVELEEQILSFLTDEQKEVFLQYSNVNVEAVCIREEFSYRRGFIDSARIKDIITGAFE